MHRLIEVVENQLAKNYRRRFNFRGKIQHTRNQKNYQLEEGGGGGVATYLSVHIDCAGHGQRPTAGCW
jgi:hypothetical protein